MLKVGRFLLHELHESKFTFVTLADLFVRISRIFILMYPGSISAFCSGPESVTNPRHIRTHGFDVCLYVMRDFPYRKLEPVKPGSHRYKIGWDGPTEVNKVGDSGRNGRIFAVCMQQKVQATPGIRSFTPEFRTFLTFVGPSYPILWRCELGISVCSLIFMF